MKSVSEFVNHVVDFFRRYAEVFVCLGISVSLFILVVGLASCRGTWTLDNKAKVNGVQVDTHIEYTDQNESGSESGQNTESIGESQND